MDNQDETLANFTAITGSDPVSARSILEATGFDLEQAVGLHFAQQGDDGGASHGNKASAASTQPHPGQAIGAPPGMMDDASVRAPLPVMRDRLYGVDMVMLNRPRGNYRERSQVDAFRDFRPEGYGGRESEQGPSQGQGLAGLFEPPHDILFQGTFDEAKEAAQVQTRWLLVNVQSNSEFASHMLNRDVWRDTTVKNIIQVGFVLYQVQDGSESGNKVKSFYRLTDLPVILVVDPITGAALRTWVGAMEPSRLLEELVPFMDHGIDDPKALSMPGSHHKRKQAAPQAPQAASMTEDEEVAIALAMSAESAQPSASTAATSAAAPAAPTGGIAAESSRSSRQAEQQAMQQSSGSAEDMQLSQKDPEAAAKEAAASLPPEPAMGGCSIAVRFPDGLRRQRRFPGDAPLATVAAFCVASNEEAAGGRPFALSESFPGAPALDDMSQTLSDARLANAMLVMRWRT